MKKIAAILVTLMVFTQSNVMANPAAVAESIAGKVLGPVLMIFSPLELANPTLEVPGPERGLLLKGMEQKAKEKAIRHIINEIDNTKMKISSLYKGLYYDDCILFPGGLKCPPPTYPIPTTVLASVENDADADLSFLDNHLEAVAARHLTRAQNNLHSELSTPLVAAWHHGVMAAAVAAAAVLQYM